MIFIVIVNLVCPYHLVLIVEYQEKEWNNESQANKQDMNPRVDLLPPRSVIRPKNDIIERKQSNSKRSYKFLKNRNGCILFEYRYVDLSKQIIYDFVECCNQYDRVEEEYYLLKIHAEEISAHLR